MPNESICDGCGDASDALVPVMGSDPAERFCHECMAQFLYARLDRIEAKIRQLRKDSVGPSLRELVAEGKA